MDRSKDSSAIVQLAPYNCDDHSDETWRLLRWSQWQQRCNHDGCNNSIMLTTRLCHAMWLDVPSQSKGRYALTRRVNFVVAAAVILLSLWRKKNAHHLGSCSLEVPICHSYIYLNSTHLIWWAAQPAPSMTRPPYLTTRPRTKWSPRLSPRWSCQGRGPQKRQ